MKAALILLLALRPGDAALASTARLSVTKHGAYTSRTVHGSATSVGGGLAVTCLHVLDGGEDPRVETPDGDRPVEVVLTDPDDDLAVVRLPGAWPALEVGEPPAVGDAVWEVGYPLDVGLTVTEGVVGGLGRDVRLPGGTHKGLIQHSAATNPGDSGGPLVDASGKLVGVVCAVRQDAQGVAYAVPAARALELVKKARGK